MVLVYAEKITPRLGYIARLIFTDILGAELTLTSNLPEFLQSERPKLNYSFRKFSNELFLEAHPFLFTATLEAPVFETGKYGDETFIFTTSGESCLPFDPLAASFFLVSRLEEYLSDQRDLHGRYPASASILRRLNLLGQPVVNRWAWLLADKISQKYPGAVFRRSRMQYLSTIDVDNAWAYRHKGFFRTFAASLKALLKGERAVNRERFQVLTGQKADPFDTYNYLQQIFRGNEAQTIFFFLAGDYARFDRSISWKNRAFRQLVRTTSGTYQTGLHPSYRSSEEEGNRQLMREKLRLQTITGAEVTRSRQHYLRLQLPQTYRKLLAAGIVEDYSMGYADEAGFRAGICTPFFFYDLENDRPTNLLIYPFQVMDVTLRDYLNLTPQEARLKIEQLMNEVKAVGGMFVSIWHNESLSDSGPWKDWRAVFEFMNRLGFQYSHE